jgi:hypothetical protein
MWGYSIGVFVVVSKHARVNSRWFRQNETYTLIAWRMKPPEPDVFIVGWVRPGSTWYRRSQTSVSEGHKYPGRARSFVWTSDKICSKWSRTN